MKRLRFSICSIMVGIVTLSLLFACQKQATTTIGANNVVFSAVIAGTSWKADSVSAFLQNDSIHSFKIMTIIGYSATKQLTLVLTDSSNGSSDSSIADKEYLITNSKNSVVLTYQASPLAVGIDSVWSQEGIGQSGQATVSEDNGPSKQITGTFHFSAEVLTFDSASVKIDTLSITNGQFKNISYRYYH